MGYITGWLKELAAQPNLMLVLLVVATFLLVFAMIWWVAISRKSRRSATVRASNAKATKQPATGSPQGAATTKLPSSFLQLVDKSGKAWLLEPLPVKIGRDSLENKVVLADERVSAVHAKIYFDERLRAVCISDENSLNGIFIDDLPTLKNILYNGVKIRLGDTVLTYQDTGYSHPGQSGK
jgi:hypothetical protein